MRRSTDQETPRILIVDDDPRSRRLLEGYVAAEGWLVRCVDNGRDGLAAARSWAPDVVLLDVMMPGLSGLDVCRSMKSDLETRWIQVMMVTALRGTPDMVLGLDTGADDYLSKPVRREELLAKLRALLRARRLLDELDEAREQLAVRNRELELKKTLAQTLVHDLKNPLSVVLGNLDLLRRASKDRALRLVERCEAAARRMKGMVEDLIGVEALEGGRCEPRLGELDLAGLARQALDDAGTVLRDNRVTVMGELPREPCPVVGDSELLRRVIDNLIANSAARSSKEGKVRLRLALEDGRAAITVVDDGPAIPQELREDVFEKFARLQLREAGISINRGLGLTFARLVVEAHGGTVRVEDDADGHTVFRMVLPASLRPGASGVAGASA